MTDKWTYTSCQFTKQGKSLLTYQLSSLFMITWSQAYIKLIEWEKTCFVVRAGLLKTFFEMHTLFRFQKMSQWSRSTSAGMYLIEMHQHYPWGLILNGLMPLQGWLSLNLKKIGFNVDFLVTNGKTLPLHGKEKIAQLRKMTIWYLNN